MARVAALAGMVGAVVGLPLLGAWLAGRELAPVFTFPPPLDVPAGYPRFGWPACLAVVLVLAAVFAPWLRRTVPTAPGQTPANPAVRQPARPGGGFPWWGWVALLWTGIWWVLAWTRFAWFEPAQLYTFFPLWLGLIVTLNALTVARTGSCLMVRSPGGWAALFGASALFWWIFEWLNRFVRNWHYLAVEQFDAVGYAFNATLCFSTVLPAVAAMAELIGSAAQLQRRAAAGPAWRWLDWRPTGWLLLGGGAIALVLTGAWPQVAYPALWVAPLALMLGLQRIQPQGRLAADLAAGDWREALPWMLGALACGFFWEMWNWHSLAKWIYTVPYVERWLVFEMPLLGYAGYLPFGLECLLAVGFVRRMRH